MKTEIYNIDGMSCAACSSAVERVTRRLEGVQESNVNLTTAKMTITYDEAMVTQEMIEEKVDKAGFKAMLVPDEQDRMAEEEETFARQEEALKAGRKRLIVAICLRCRFYIFRWDIWCRSLCRCRISSICMQAR